LARKSPCDCLILGTATSVGGMKCVTRTLTHDLVSRGWNVRTVFPDTPRSPAMRDWSRAQGVEAELSTALRDAADPHSLRGVLQFSQYVRDARLRVASLHGGDNFISSQQSS
jgi:hypothetical protein